MFRELVYGFRKLHFVGPCVTVFGSARFNEHHRYYAMGKGVPVESARVLAGSRALMTLPGKIFSIAVEVLNRVALMTSTNRDLRTDLSR